MGDAGRPTYDGLKQKVAEKDAQLDEALAIIKELTEALQGVRACVCAALFSAARHRAAVREPHSALAAQKAAAAAAAAPPACPACGFGGPDGEAAPADEGAAGEESDANASEPEEVRLVRVCSATSSSRRGDRARSCVSAHRSRRAHSRLPWRPARPCSG